MILKSLIFVHRWLGILLCLLFLLWFPSGIGMMYWGYPGVSAADRLDRSPKLDLSKIMLSPADAADKIGVQANPAQIRLNSFAGRPVYRFTGGGRGRGGRMVYADTGEEQTEVSPEMLDRIASSWTGQPLSETRKISVEEVDQWTVAGQLRNLRPMYKYSWPDGEQVYLNGTTGEVVQYTTFGTRLAAHVSAIPHWIYYTPLRKNQPVWLRFMIWTSGIGTIGAIIGIVVAVWMYSPGRKYRLEGKPTGIPYRGQKRWHTIFGLVFGVATVTWTFSGMMSLDPFPSLQRQPPEPQPQPPTQTTPATPGQAASAASAGQVSPGPQQEPANGQFTQTPQPRPQSNDGKDDLQARGRGRGGDGRGRRGSNRAGGRSAVGQRRGVETATDQPSSGGQVTPTPAQGGSGTRRGGQQGLAGALRGRVRMVDFASVQPRDLLSKASDLEVKELEFTSFAGTPLFSANLGGGKSQLLSLDGAKVDGFDQQRIIDIVKSTASNPEAIETKLIDQYDLYYLDRTRQRPLPVLRVLMHDSDHTRVYIDPKTARVLTTYNDRNWAGRWLYNGLHSLDFPWLYNYRPLWDIVVITFMLGGTALCVTSLVLAWRALGRSLKRAKTSDVLTAET